MDTGNSDNFQSPFSPRRFHLRKWLRWKHKGGAVAYPDAGGSAQDDQDDEDDPFNIALEMRAQPDCIVSNELRILVGTWNVAGRSPIEDLVVDLDEWLNLKDPADIFVLGFQEVVPLRAGNVLRAEDTSPAAKWNSLIGKSLNNRCSYPWMATRTPILHGLRHDEFQFPEGSSIRSRAPTPTRERHHHDQNISGHNSYWPIVSKKMVGVFITIWAKNDLLRRHCISKVKISSVGCGIMGYLGNKGSISVSMHVEGTSLCFIAAHLASGEKRGDEARRNYQASEIFRRTTFPRHSHDDRDFPYPSTILGHDQIFWLGDLNYRLCLEDSLARQLIKKQDWKALQEFDELKKEQGEGGVFQGWKEGNIEFAPTYKYSTSNQNRYSGGIPSKTGEKQRTPAWCDRIMWLGKNVKQLSYVRSESRFSDHRPVSALFSTQVEVMRCSMSAIKTTINFSNLQISKGDGNEGKCTATTLLSLLSKDMEDLSEQENMSSTGTTV